MAQGVEPFVTLFRDLTSADWTLETGRKCGVKCKRFRQHCELQWGIVMSLQQCVSFFLLAHKDRNGSLRETWFASATAVRDAGSLAMLVTA